MEKEKDYKKFAELMATMAIAMDKDVSIERAEIYFRVLKEFDIDTIEKAFYHLIKTEKIPTFPTIGKIRWLIEGEEDELIEADALEAWSEACKLVWSLGDSGNNSGVSMLDEAVRIAFGGWKHFGDTNPQYEGADRKHFINVYKSVARKAKRLSLQAPEIRKRLEENREKMEKITKESFKNEL